MITLVVLAGLVTPPAGWTGGADRELVEQNGKLGHFGGVHGVIEAERWSPPGSGNVVMYVTRVAVNTADLNSAAAAELAAAHPSKDAGIVETGWTQADDARALVTLVGWKDPIGKTVGSARLVIAATSDRIVSVKGECVAAEGADVSACEKAIATIDTGIAAKDRVAIQPTAAPAPPPEPTTTLRPATLSDGSRVPLPPMAVPQDRPTTDRRPVYVGLGVITLTALFWWNRRRRERFEAEDRGEQHD